MRGKNIFTLPQLLPPNGCFHTDFAPESIQPAHVFKSSSVE